VRTDADIGRFVRNVRIPRPTTVRTDRTKAT
jgi:hypothetical protein